MTSILYLAPLGGEWQPHRSKLQTKASRIRGPLPATRFDREVVIIALGFSLSISSGVPRGIQGHNLRQDVEEQLSILLKAAQEPTQNADTMNVGYRIKYQNTRMIFLDVNRVDTEAAGRKAVTP